MSIQISNKSLTSRYQFLEIMSYDIIIPLVITFVIGLVIHALVAKVYYGDIKKSILSNRCF